MDLSVGGEPSELLLIVSFYQNPRFVACVGGTTLSVPSEQLCVGLIQHTHAGGVPAGNAPF